MTTRLPQRISRRGFLKLTASLAAGLALPRPFLSATRPPDELPFIPPRTGRVQAPALYYYDQPSRDSHRLGVKYFDNLLTILNEVEGEIVGRINAAWLHLPDGYIHSSYLQLIQPRLNLPVSPFPPGGFPGEITVPFVDARKQPARYSGILYRLYFQSVYWVRALVQNDDGQAWYKLHDDRLDIYYYVPASTVRRVTRQELSPLSPEVEDKRIAISLSEQRLIAYEGEQAVLDTAISSGRRIYKDNAWTGRYLTPTGKFRVERKQPSRHMGNGKPAAESDYELPGVPWVSYFHWSGIAFHGTYWHNNYGVPLSQGCINLPPKVARWVYRWTLPLPGAGEDTVLGAGTEVEVTL